MTKTFCDKCKKELTGDESKASPVEVLFDDAHAPEIDRGGNLCNKCRKELDKALSQFFPES